ncbi:MAG TPA: TonB family protein [Terriglobia bacterium]|nr:TonB family protein [Terriglobia bacterium]
MGATVFPLLPDRRESLRGNVLASLALHVLVFASLILYSHIGPRMGDSWGANGGGAGDSVKVNAVTSLPGIPLPSPMISTPNTVATENPGLYKSEPEPKPKEIPQAEEIPKFKDAIKPEKVERVNKRIQHNLPPPIPPNVVPFGEGGPPAQNYAQFTTRGGGDFGIGFGQESFGDRYAWYVTALRNRISNNWLISTVSPNLMSAPRVYVTFDVLRDGTISGVQITQSSGIPEVDRSAVRAVVASSPVNPLPADYSGGRLTVKFYFDFRR